MNKVIVTRPMLGICHMQVCAHKDATDEEILDVCNRENPAGTSAGWGSIVRNVSDTWGDMRPVPCKDDPARVHYVIAC